MAFNPQSRVLTPSIDRAADIDVGLRAYMLRVYNYMAVGLTLTGVISYVVAHTPALLSLFYIRTAVGVEPTMLAYIAMFSPLAFVLILSFGIQRMKAATAQLVFWAFAGVMGLSITHIFLTYTGASIVRVFFISASVFAAMSLYGYTTKRDLSGMGSFLFMGLIGIIIASVVNIFLASTMMHFIISVIGVLVFVGLTAYDTQGIKETYNVSDSGEVMQKKAIYGALRLYLDFINLFLMLLRLFGSRN
jgi:FtsH-binding integral membrane protein